MYSVTLSSIVQVSPGWYSGSTASGIYARPRKLYPYLNVLFLVLLFRRAPAAVGVIGDDTVRAIMDAGRGKWRIADPFFTGATAVMPEGVGGAAGSIYPANSSQK